MVKVLFVLDSLNRGGAEIWALDVCRNAKANGIDLVFVATGGGTLEEDFKTSGVEFIRLNRQKPIDFRLVKQLRKLIREHDIKIIHTNQAVEGLHAYLATVGMNVKHVLSFHGHIPDAKNLWTSRLLYLLMDANVVGTNEFKTLLADELKLPLDKRCKVVYYGVDEKRLQSNTNTVREEIGLSDDVLLFGMIGNFYAAPRKDHLTVCRALPKLFQEFPNAHFIFVYAGGQDEDMEKQKACVAYCESQGISERVHFAGNRFAAKDVIHALDVFVLSTLHESFGIAVVEAMLIGKPCILSDLAVLIEVSDGGNRALIFKRSDENDLAQKMISLARNADERKDLGERGKQIALDRYSIEANLSSLKNLYQSIL